MRIVVAVCIVAAAVVTLSCLPSTMSVAAAVEEKDHTGAWDGDAGRAADWGKVNLKSIDGGYVGTYAGTFNGQLGSLSFDKSGDGKYKGRWWESDLKRFGTCELEVSKDGGTVKVMWKALDDRKGAEKSGKSTWKRMSE
jgi:hypothetical protein